MNKSDTTVVTDLVILCTVEYMQENLWSMSKHETKSKSKQHVFYKNPYFFLKEMS